MNSCFYLAIDRLPLGTVAAIEFLPVIVLAAVAARTRRNVLALVLAVTGVYLLTDVRLVVDPIGVVFAAANAVLFALYIVLGHRVANSDQVKGIDGLALAMLIAAAVACRSAPAMPSPRSPTRSRWPPVSASDCPPRSFPTSATSSRWPDWPAPPTR